jgi:hypothetical protein
LNERIKQLWAKAAESNFGDSWEEQTAFMSKFAELIVKDLIDSMIKRYGDDDELPIQEIKLFVKEHFGVEE